MSPLIERTCRPDATHRPRDTASTRGHVEDVGDVVADPRQCAEVDFGEAEPAMVRSASGSVVPEADGRAAQSAIG